MVLLLSDEDVRGLIAVKECIPLMEDAFRELQQGIAQNPPRSSTRFYPPISHPGYLFRCMIGAVPKFGKLALRIYSVLTGIENDQVIHEIQRKSLGLVLLFSLKTSELEAIIPEFTLSGIRVGATTAVGTKYLAPRDCNTIGLLGSGKMARANLEALCAVRDIDTVQVFSPNPAHRRSFCEEMNQKVEASIIPVDNPRDAVENATLITTATNATSPVFDGDWLMRGVHVNCIVGDNPMRELGGKTRREYDDRTIQRANVIVVNSKLQARQDRQPLWEASERSLIDFNRVRELGELVTGEFGGRPSEDAITLFHNNCGMGIQFAASGAVVYELARQKGIGKELPLEWFTTDISKWFNKGFFPST